MRRFCHPAKKAFKNLFGCVFRATNPSMYIPPGEVLWARESFSLEEPCALGLTPASCKNYAVCYWTCNLLQLLNRSQPVHTACSMGPKYSQLIEIFRASAACAYELPIATDLTSHHLAQILPKTLSVNIPIKYVIYVLERGGYEFQKERD